MSRGYARPLPEIITADIIRDESLAVLRSRDRSKLSPELVVLLVMFLYADEEGIARPSPNMMRRWCSGPIGERASLRYVQHQIDRLINAGVLAPGSTPGELRSMIGRRADDNTTTEGNR